jgi:hypothetical protein
MRHGLPRSVSALETGEVLGWETGEPARDEIAHVAAHELTGRGASGSQIRCIVDWDVVLSSEHGGGSRLPAHRLHELSHTSAGPEIGPSSLSISGMR